MNARVAGLLALLAAACSTPPPAAEHEVAQAFAAAMGPAPARVAAALTPPGRQSLITGQITVEVEGHLAAVRCRDGGWLVQVPAAGASVVGYSSTEGHAGAMLNVRGTNQVDVHAATLPLPCAIVPGDALVVASTGSGRGGYWAVPGRSVCDEMMAVVFVSYPVGPSLLRPPAVGNSWLARWFRSVPIPEAQVDLERLPAVVDVASLGVDWSAWGAAEPTIGYLTGLLRPFGGECYDGWATDTRTPDHQHPGYGSAYASVVSQALVQLCSTAPAAAKRDLALAVVQRGLDLIGAWSDGRRTYPLGGHGAGRKALIVATGHLLGVELLADPTAIVGPRFAEDAGYRAGSWWWGDDWSAVWAFRLEAPFDGRLLASPPAIWGPVDAAGHDSWAWMVAGYLPQVVGAQVGTALAMRLLGRTREMGVSLDAMVEQWMRGPPAEADADLRAAGIVLPWGRDYSMVRGAGFCAAAWRKTQRTL